MPHTYTCAHAHTHGSHPVCCIGNTQAFIKNLHLWPRLSWSERTLPFPCLEFSSCLSFLMVLHTPNLFWQQLPANYLPLLDWRKGRAGEKGGERRLRALEKKERNKIKGRQVQSESVHLHFLLSRGSLEIKSSFYPIPTCSDGCPSRLSSLLVRSSTSLNEHDRKMALVDAVGMGGGDTTKTLCAVVN